MIWGGGAEEICEMNLFFPGNPFHSASQNLFFPGEGPSKFFFFDFLRPRRSLLVVPLGVVHFCVRFFSNEQCSVAGGWVGSGQVAVHLENEKKYVRPEIVVEML